MDILYQQIKSENNDDMDHINNSRIWASNFSFVDKKLLGMWIAQ